MPRQRKLPLGLWKRGDCYYARFMHSGREIRKRLSTDFDVAREALNQLRVRGQAIPSAVVLPELVALRVVA